MGIPLLTASAALYSGAVQPRCHMCSSRKALTPSTHRVQDSTTDFAAQYKGDNDQGTPAQTGADASARPGANTPKGVGEIRNPKTPTLPNALGGRLWIPLASLQRAYRKCNPMEFAYSTAQSPQTALGLRRGKRLHVWCELVLCGD